MRRKVVIGLTGLVLDASKWGADRWSRWRPTVSIFQHEDLLIDRFELLHTQASAGLADEIQDDVRSVSPETEVVRHELEFGDASASLCMREKLTQLHSAAFCMREFMQYLCSALHAQGRNHIFC